MKITKKQLRKIIAESSRLSEQQEPAIEANKLLDQTMTFLEKKLYGKYPDEQVDTFAVEAMAVMGKIEGLLVKLIKGGYREDY